MKNPPACVLFAALLSIAVSIDAWAQAAPGPTLPVPRLTDPIHKPGEIPLYVSGAPKLEGGAKAERWNLMGDDIVVRNVIEPTILPFIPDPARATGAAVLVAPGGGFMMLSIRNEGWDVAQWLADHGVAAFVLKYRVIPTPADEAEFDRFGRERIGAAFRSGPGASAPPAFQPAIDDGIAALKLIRSRAAEWKIDPDRLGMIGFSAGARNTLSVALAQREGARPAFIGLIYGPMAATSVPADAPPVFAALAADDPLFGRSGIGLLDSWRQAGRPAEFHLYQRGGHGFGMRATGTAQLWPEQFLAWLRMNGLLEGT
jgi:acetyl esterase/lipase